MKTVRVVQPVDYDTALADTTVMFEIQTHDGAQFISKKASLEGDSVIVVRKGHQVQTDEWRQATLAKVPIRIPVGSVTQVSQVETRGEAGVAFAVFVIALIAIGLSTGGPWIGD